jgi:hypothetical protein
VQSEVGQGGLSLVYRGVQQPQALEFVIPIKQIELCYLDISSKTKKVIRGGRAHELRKSLRACVVS